MASSEVVSHESLVSLRQDVVPYLLDWPGADFDGASEVAILVAEVRAGGFLGVVPVGFIPEEVLSVGNSPNPPGPVGPSVALVVPSALLEEGSLALTGQEMPVLVVDFSESVLSQVRLPGPLEVAVFSYDADQQFSIPHPQTLLIKVQEWVLGGGEASGLGYYTADSIDGEELADGEMDGLPEEETPPRAQRRKPTVPGRGQPTMPGKRPTVASLAGSLEKLLDANLGMQKQLEALSSRQQALEQKSINPAALVPAHQAVLRQPISSALTGLPVSSQDVAQQVGAPPRTVAPASPGLLRSPLVKPAALGELEVEKYQTGQSSSGDHLAQAVLAQSTALTALVQQLASQTVDPLLDLGTSGSTASTRGAQGRAKLQMDLAAQKGVFFNAVLASMARRMHPTLPIDGTPMELMARGGLRDEVSGEVWRFREASGAGLSSTSGYDNLGFPPIGKPGRSQGCSRSFGGDVGPGCLGQREVRFGAVVVPSGGTTVDSVFSQAHDHLVQSLVLQPFSRSEVGDSGLGVCERVGLDFKQAPGARVKASSLRRRRQDFRRARETKAFSKEEGQRWKGRRSTARGRGSVTGVVAGEYEKVCEGQESNPLNTTMNFQTWASCLPRWILKTRTQFSRCLALSFSAVCRSNEMASATFPLPLASLDCFRGSGPGLSRRRFWILCKARLLNIWILILDFMFLGRWPTLEELRRCPNISQHAVFDRLRTFIVACGDAQAEFNLCPGRSSPELGASLYQLERFCDVCPELATGYMEDSTVPFKQDPSLLSADLFPELVPYRSLDPSRLRLVGEGSWPMEVFMDGVLWLPFQEPRFLLHDMPVCADDQPCLDAEDPNDCLALARLWDVRGLLFLADQPSRPGLFSRVFNCYKNHEQDRQIGDRRIVNQAELHVDGPSKHLPQGQQLTMLKLPRYTHMLRGSVTDRRDFYHQASVTAERAMSNMLPFSYACDAFAGTTAFEKFKEKSLEHGRFDREMRGDGFRNPEEKNRRTRRKSSPALPERLYPCFNSLFQGDHLGVEFALKSHMTLLEGVGLLDCSTRIQGHHAFPKGPRWDALVIDDYFALSCEPLRWCDSDTFAMHALSKARLVYEAESLLGSPEKDVVAQPVVKAAGAEIRSVEGNVRAGVVPVGAPFCKRLALAALTLRAAKLPGITPKLAARLAGNWVAILQYRKCWSSLIDSLFAFASRADDLNQKVVLCLERSIAQELALVSAVAPLIFSNIAVDYLAQVFATDASLEKGAIVSAPIALDLCERLWLTGDKKGAYTHLDNGFRAVLRHLGEVDDDLDAPNPKACEVSPKKPPLMYFDFVEICGGAGKVADAMVRRGHSVAPVLDLSESPHYDLTSLRLLEWIIYMLEENRFRSFW